MRFPQICALVALIAVELAAPAVAAQAEVRTDTPSGRPVPRFVSFKNAETFCRSGPSFEHAVTATYVRAGTPVQVVAETIDHWRKIRDADGAECWVHQTTLVAPTHALVLEETVLLARPSIGAAVRARLGPGVLARIEGGDGVFAKLSLGAIRGWADSQALWGVEPRIAAHN